MKLRFLKYRARGVATTLPSNKAKANVECNSLELNKRNSRMDRIIHMIMA